MVVLAPQGQTLSITEKAQSFLSKLGTFSLSGPNLTRDKIHLILDAGATPLGPRLLLPARCMQGQAENDVPSLRVLRIGGHRTAC